MDAPFEVLWGTDGGPLTSLVTLDVDQTLAPNDLTDAGAVWEDLGGNHTITGNTLVVELTDNANGSRVVIADAIRVERVSRLPEPVQIVDNGNPGHALTGAWNASSTGYLGDKNWVGSGAGAKVSTWTFTVTPGNYQVAATWEAASNRATDAPFRVLDGGAPFPIVDLNQEMAPNDTTVAGASWENIGTYAITTTTLTVELSDDANEIVIADAIRIEEVPPLLAAALPQTTAAAAPLTPGDLADVVPAAIDFWQAAGLTAGQLALLEDAEYRIADLSGLRLGEAGSGSVTIDADAAGYGWFIDATPAVSEEFNMVEGGVLVARRESAAEGRMDLLTTVLHEMGHLLGRGHGEGGDLMAARLSASQRLLPGDYATATDAVFGCDDVL
jgi:hypothetical protein